MSTDLKKKTFFKKKVLNRKNLIIFCMFFYIILRVYVASTKTPKDDMYPDDFIKSAQIFLSQNYIENVPDNKY